MNLSRQLLMFIPERIWAAVEGGRLAEGAQLFLLAQYVHTGLQGGAGGGLTAEKVSLLPYTTPSCPHPPPLTPPLPS